MSRQHKPTAVICIMAPAWIRLALFAMVMVMAIVFVSPFQSDWVEDFRLGWLRGAGYTSEEYGCEQAGEISGVWLARSSC